MQKHPFRIFYMSFVPKATRKKINKKANLLQKQHVAVCWDIFLNHYFSNRLEHFSLIKKKQFSDQKIIWQYWGQGLQSDLPEMVELCFSSVERFKADYQIIRLDDQNIKDFLDLPDFVWEKKGNPKFKPAFFADLIRLALLSLYGGVWLDATILLTAPIDHKILDSEYFMFQRSQFTLDKELWYQYQDDYFDWSDSQRVNVLNSFIVAKKGNPVISTCLDIMLNYWKTQSNIPHYFFFHIMFDILIKEYFMDQQCQVIDDTLPHLLQVKLNSPFNQIDYDEILNKINIHKLTYMKNVTKNSYYEYLIKEFLN